MTKLYVGCLPCLLLKWSNTHADYHHVVEGRKRLGHFVGFGMCLWHHRGELDPNRGTDMLAIEETLGPSFARNKKGFKKFFGEERTFVKTNDYAIGLWQWTPWLEHCMPERTASSLRVFHQKQRSGH